MRVLVPVDQYDLDTFALRSDESGLKCEDRTLAHQSFQEECDINTIVKRFGLTGEVPQNLRMPEYGDYTGISDFHSAIIAIQKAEENFMQVPAEIRKRFDNDPQKFLVFCSDPANLDEARKLGLAPAPEPVVAVATPVAAAVAAPVVAPATP